MSEYTDDCTTEEVLQSIWAEGKHSLCAQRQGHGFEVVGFFENPADLIERAALLPEGSNVWWGVHGMDHVTKGRGGVDDVVDMVCMAADFDWEDEAHKGADLPTEQFVWDALERMTPRPTLVINSGHGVQAYWAFSDRALGPQEGRELSDGFFRYLEAEYGLKNDRKDLASILRVPGTINHKTEPVEVTIEHYEEQGVVVDWVREHAWLPEPAPPAKPAPVSPGLPVSSLNGGLARIADGESPADFVRRTMSIEKMLSDAGWQYLESRGDDSYWVRPAKIPATVTVLFFMGMRLWWCGQRRLLSSSLVLGVTIGTVAVRCHRSKFLLPCRVGAICRRRRRGCEG